jgi:hypothetical protein
LITWLYLKGVSTGDLSEALQALLRPEAPGLSATTVTWLKAVKGAVLLTSDHNCAKNLLSTIVLANGPRYYEAWCGSP